MFCVELGQPPLPASEQRLCLFAAYLAKENLAHSSIRGYLAAVRHFQVARGLGDPRIAAMPKLEQVLRGIKRSQAANGRRERQRTPMSVEGLEVLRRIWSRTPGGQDARMLWAAATLCFFGFMRSGELTTPSGSQFDEGAYLCFQDVSTDSVENPTLIRVRIKSSKTDQARKGCTITIGRTGGPLCPVAAVLGFMAARGSRPGPLFLGKGGRPMTRARFVWEVKTALSRAGLDSTGYSGHSFRIGAATTAAHVGVGDATIKALGRWKSGAYQGYIQNPREQLAGITRKLLDGSPAQTDHQTAGDRD